MITRAFRAAYNKGRQSFQCDGEDAVCPYPDKRAGRYDHIITFSRAFQRFWHEGFDDEKAGLPTRYPAQGESDG